MRRPEAYEAWVNRDLEPHLHREAYLHVLRKSGLPDHHAEALYERVIDPTSWTPYPDTAEVLGGLHRQGIKTAVVSNIAFDVRPAFEAIGAAETSTSSCCRSKSARSSPTPRSSKPR